MSSGSTPRLHCSHILSRLLQTRFMIQEARPRSRNGGGGLAGFKRGGGWPPMHAKTWQKQKERKFRQVEKGRNRF